MALTEKLYPPYIEGSLPAFSGNSLTIHYTMNRGVSLASITGFALQIKKITTNKVITTIFKNKESDEKLGQVTFDLSGLTLAKGYYKLQLAFKNENEIGYYSTPGVIRYIEEPKIEILDFDAESMRVRGQYSPENSGEYLYSYKYDLYNSDHVLVDTSEEINFNYSNAEDDNKALLVYNFNYTPVFGQRYYTILSIKTGNEFELSTPPAETDDDMIQALPSIMPTAYLEILASNNYDNGYIEIKVKALKRYGKDLEPMSGGFRLGRASSKDNFRNYEEILDFELINEIPNKIIYKDYFVEHGVEYRYAYQQYNKAYKDQEGNAIISRKIWSNQVQSTFEDMFLTDGTQQFKIRYNPKVSSYKTTTQETKIETLGGQYPFFFRNGSVKYKELGLSGLISYLGDEKELFMKKPLYFRSTSNLTDDNMIVEREFREQVFEWLNNGEVKYFKSPAEGSLLVRLMNISLSPTDSLSRMIYSFNATASEIGANTRDNLEKYHLLSGDKFIPTDNIYSIGEHNLLANTSIDFNQVEYLEVIVNQQDTAISLKEDYNVRMNRAAGTRLTINGSSIFVPVYIKKYIVPITSNHMVIRSNKDVKIIYQVRNDGQAHDSNNLFETIKNVNWNQTQNKRKFPTLQINQIYGDEGYLDVKEILEDRETLADENEIAFFAYLWFYKNPDSTSNNEEDYSLEINGEIINLSKVRSYYLENIDFISSMHIGTGVVLECAYYLNTITYER